MLQRERQVYVTDIFRSQHEPSSHHEGFRCEIYYDALDGLGTVPIYSL